MIWIHEYALNEKRRGALLKVQKGESIGYTDLHPWPELGDPTLRDSLMGKGPLLERALKLAEIDAEHRLKRIPVDLSTVPNSHYFLTDLAQIDQAIEEGFSSVKWKVSAFSDNLIRTMEDSSIRWRLDANHRLTKEEFFRFQRCDNIEFFEDPYPGKWEKGKIPLAYDRGPEPETYDIRVVKPALHRWEEMPTTHPIVVTSYLGHPLGQIADAYVATLLPKTLDCGLLSHRCYPKNAFSERLSWRGPALRHPGGTGFGFDDLLEKLQWSEYVGNR